ncbi:AAA family ATPase [Belnapia sp. T18]|uniref:AAA family ATPase n=1 Tax=Belnapia arida TaxID=2804533 RepID=A0ABS1U9I2_9PROT|nr:cellulose synthase operon protein YhjQ/BcsQ [Belnapia arida]MBL6079946.1 AAA family ATPase [Belnapia arida]
MPLICIAAPKGGVGKTTLAANLAGALHCAGQPVLAMDCDPQNALRLHFGLPVWDGAGFLMQLPLRPDWRSLVRDTASGVALLPHGANDIRTALRLAAALEREPELLLAPVRAMLAEPGLILVADLPPGPSQMLNLLAPLADLVVTVLLADANSAALVPEIDSGRFLGSGALSAPQAARVRIVLNQVEATSRLSRAVAEAMVRHLGPRLLGAVCRDEAVAEALAAQRLLHAEAPGSAAALDIEDIARGIAALLPPLPLSTEPVAP